MGREESGALHWITVRLSEVLHRHRKDAVGVVVHAWMLSTREVGEEELGVDGLPGLHTTSLGCMVPCTRETGLIEERKIVRQVGGGVAGRRWVAQCRAFVFPAQGPEFNLELCKDTKQNKA